MSTPSPVRTRSLPHDAVRFVVLAALVFIGAFGGLSLALSLAPGSVIAGIAGFLTFTVPLIAGMSFWLGTAVLTAIWHIVRRSPAPPVIEIPPGSFVFVPVCFVLVTLAGVLVALGGSTLGFAATIGLYALLGVVYGFVCWLSARSGYLPFVTV